MAVTGAFFVPHPPLIIPGIGDGREREISATINAYNDVAGRVAALQPETVVILTPHATMYADYIHISPGSGARGSLARFGATAVIEVEYDTALVSALSELCQRTGIHAGTLGEKEPALDHGTLIPLHFFQAQGLRCKLVRISPSGLSRRDHYRFGTLIQLAAEARGRRVAVVASGDLSHKLRDDGPYGYAPEGPVLDKAITDILQTGDFGKLFHLEEGLCSRGAECGLLPLVMMAGAVDGSAITPELLSYEGPFGVGYAVAAFQVESDDAGRKYLEEDERVAREEVSSRRPGEDAYIRLARDTLEAYVRSGRMPPCPDNLSPALTGERAGVFVSLKKHGELRGCIGTVEPSRASVAEEIRYNAVSAGTRDPRFPPVQPGELGLLTYSVDILLPPAPAIREELDPARYGVIASCGAKRGLLLPNLDGVNTVEEQIAIALRKGGIDPKSPYKLERFEVVRHR